MGEGGISYCFSAWEGVISYCLGEGVIRYCFSAWGRGLLATAWGGGGLLATAWGRGLLVTASLLGGGGYSLLLLCLGEGVISYCFSAWGRGLLVTAWGRGLLDTAWGRGLLVTASLLGGGGY